MTWLDQLELNTVILHLIDNGPSIKGLATAIHDDCVVLRDAFVMEPEGQALLDGDVVIPRERVLFMQRVGVSA